MLEARDLDFGHPGRPVGRGVSFVLRPGEVVALLGPNGGGKTTLLRTILGLLPAQAGDVLLEGRPLAALTRREIARRVGYVPQAHVGYFPFAVLDLVLMGRTARLGLFATPSRSDRVAAEAALETLGVLGLRDEPYTRVSGGERQLVLLARALAQEPALLVLDEPTASLDLGNQVRVLATLRQLAARGIGVFFSTHDPDQALLVADRAGLLFSGRLDRFGPPAAVLSAGALTEAYGVAVEVHRLGPEDDRPRLVCVPRLTR